MPNLQDDAARFRKADYLAISALFSIALAVFWFSPVTQVTDSHYSLLLSDSLLNQRRFTLDHYGLPRYQPQVGIRDDYVANGPMWQLEIVDNHLYYYFPPGSSVLSIPFVAVARVFGTRVVNGDGTYNEQAEIALQKAIAAVLMSLCVVVVYTTARYLLPVTWSVLIALAAGFGTQVWSTMSRALWSHTWETLLASLLVLLLVRHEVAAKRLHSVLLGTIAAWLYFVRPSAALVIAALLIYLITRGWRQLIQFVVTTSSWFLLFFLYSWREFGTLLPSYYKPSRLRLDLFPIALAGNLVSPSRGLLVYVPILLFVAFLLVRFWPYIRSHLLAGLALGVVIGHVLLVSSFANRLGDWWAGASYGPRYLSELVPWFVLLAVLGVDGLKRSGVRLQNFTITIGALLLTLSVSINARGALAEATWKWTQPINDKQMRALLWDWRRPQFLAGWQRPPPFVDVPELQEGMKLIFSSRDVDKYLWYGWSSPEPEFRWTDGREATIAFRLESARNIRLLLKVAPFTVEGKIDNQEVRLLLNDRPLKTLSLQAGGLRDLELDLPASFLATSNVLTFQLPNAASPEALGVGGDKRQLGIQVQSLAVIDNVEH